MKRIDTPTKAVDLFGEGKHGYKDGNPLSGDAATQLNASQFNHLQEEIANAIELAGIPLNAAKYDQLYTALQLMISARIQPAVSEVGQCYFQKSGSNLVLMPCNGNKIRVDGGIAEIPDAGVSLFPAGLPANTSHYAYAYMSDDEEPELTIEASTVPYSIQSDTGIAVKAGDASRTLVGQFRTNAASSFVDVDKQRLVLSWFNRQPKPLSSSLSANLSNPGNNAISADLHLEFLTWANAQVHLSVVGTVIANTVVCYAGVAIDGTVVKMASSTSAQNSVANVVCPIFLSSLSEGYHYADFASKAGAVTYQGDSSTYGDTYHTGFVMG